MFKTIFLTLIFISSANAMTIKGSFWSKNLCNDLTPECLPKKLSEVKAYELAKPEVNSFTRLLIKEGEYQARIIWTLRASSPDYYSFQVEVLNSEGEILSLCSRFEAVESFEKAMAGACAGLDSSINQLIGFSLYP
ncbi:MAG: hypothetical protein GY909_05645 [Oligoflexia bacterium]|nr:hypothetical protein [Oligoflexia bacterium]